MVMLIDDREAVHREFPSDGACDCLVTIDRTIAGAILGDPDTKNS
jgi:hypothetical protein